MLLLLLLAAVEDDRRPEIPDRGRVDDRCARVAHRFVEDDLIPQRHLEAAVLLRPRRRDPALRRQLLQEFAAELVALVVDRIVSALPVGWQVFSQELVDLAAQALLL